MFNSMRMPEEQRQPRGSRANNYNDFECLELIRVVKKYAHIIEYKDDGKNLYTHRFITNDDRNRAWDAICREFNIRTGWVERSVASLKSKWNNDKSNIRDYVQYLETSQSRSGRPPEEIPKPKFMNVIAEIIGSYCPALGPIPNIDEIDLGEPETPVQAIKEEPSIENTGLPFEELMANDNSDQFNFNIAESSSLDSFNETTAPNQPLHPPPPKRTKQSNQLPPLFQSNGTSASANTNSEIQELQIQLLKRQIEVQDKQIEVQELMAEELRIKIKRTQQLMKMDTAESELRCREISKRLES
ncbi:uncharacterized protein LOC129570702 [Sitodiplosis mosellana]|uniref:uncharacterized protein LOC129570702 n=1 Tax=Sitodiplosis mosellana TaxID=263140 RepID=UPI002443DEEC|nr:uncharacterized protein LOC129570702 [Sitodiplosis mosellana]